MLAAMADVVDIVPSLLTEIRDQLVELNARNERLDDGQQRQTEILVKLEAGQRLHTDQLSQLNRRVERLDLGQDRLTGQVTKLTARVDDLNGKVDDLNGKVDVLNGRVDVLNGRVGDLDGKVGRLAAGQAKTNEQLGTVIRSLDQEVVTRLRDVERRLGVVETTVGIER
jgi:chromosome segregation ATPase